MTQLPPPLAMNVSRARVLLLKRFPFFGHLALSAPIKGTSAVPTAGASSTSIYINSEFFSKLSISEQAQVLSHEIMHLALRHKGRQRWRKRSKWNVATDLVVNDILKEQGFKLMDGALTPELVFRDPENMPDMNDINAETIYSVLPDYPVLESAMETSLLPNDLVEDDMEGEEESGKHINWEFQLKAAAKHSRLSHGDLPGWMEREIGLTRPKFDWVSIMSYFVGTVARQDRTYRRLSKRHMWRGSIMPKNSGYKASLAVVIDASGSIMPSKLDLFVSEINNISLTINQPFRVLVHDTAVTLDIKAKPGDCSIKSVKGGGGTDFRPAIEKLGNDPPDGVIWFTDGYGYYPDEKPDFPILWILTRRHLEPPFGWTTVMKDE